MSSTDASGEPDATEQEPSAPPGMHRGPLAVAGAVLLLWVVWLFVPESAKQDLLSALSGADPVHVAAAVAATGRAEAEASPEPTTDATVEPTVEPATGPAARATVVPSTEASAESSSEPSSEPSVDEPSVEAPAVSVPEIPPAGTGVFAVVPGGSGRVGSGALVRYTVEVEGGLPLDGTEVAAVVDATLADPRSWTARGEWALERVDSGGDARIRVASPATTDALCAPLDTAGIYSCRNGDDVVLNAVRWVEGAESWGEDVVGYRGYLVNHEFGHYLGNGHVGCPAPGRPAPVMMQQTKTVGKCLPSSWPYP